MMDGGTITGIIQCFLAGAAIVVDIFLTVYGKRFLADRKDKREKSAARAAIEEGGSSISAESEAKKHSANYVVNKKLKKQARNILKHLKKKHKNTYPTISAISIVIAFKKLYDGNESSVVSELNIVKQKGYLTWSGDKLLPSTNITINKENDLIDYLSSRES